MRKHIITFCLAVGLAAPLVGFAMVRRAQATIVPPGSCGSCDGTPRMCGVVITPTGSWNCYGYGMP